MPASLAVALIVLSACQGGAGPVASAAPAGQPTAPAGVGPGAGPGIGAAARAPLDAAIQDLSRGLIFPQQPTPFSYQQRELAPVAAKISVSPLGPDGTVTVTGAPGAIPATQLSSALHDLVEVDSIETMTAQCAPAGRDGSFSIRLQTGPGATLLVNARAPGTCSAQGPMTSPSAVLRVPDGTTPGPTLPFRHSAFNGRWHWSASGELMGPAAFLDLRSDDLPPGQCFVPRLHVYRLFDAQGLYVSQVNVNASGPVLTPTGLPLETDQGPNHYWALATLQPAAQCLRGGARYDLSGWTSGLDPGWYAARLVWYIRLGDGSEQRPDAPPGREEDAHRGEEGYAQSNVGIEANTGVGYLPLANVGNAAAPLVPATLFNDGSSWGSGGLRGVVAKEDQGRFGLDSRIAFPGEYVASPHDPLSGRRVKYLLEPFLPSIAYSAFDFASPQPLFTLDARRPGQLSVSITKPDGKTTELAKDAPIVQQFLGGTIAGASMNEPAFSGPGRTFAITTGLPALLVDFDQYGKTTVTLSGTLRSVWGQELRIRGTYEFTVAEPLDISLGTFMGTPLEVGAELNPTIAVHPGVPADVQMSVDFYPNGDATKKQPFQTAGKANRDGYFAPKDVWKAPGPGEYLSRVTASWKDPANGTLWMGARTSASIVATPNTPLIAHGQRNVELAILAKDNTLRTWFFTRAFDPACGEASCDPIGKREARTVGPYPFFRGDVAWMADMSPITPSITLEDPTGILGTLAPQVASQYEYCSPAGCADAPDSKKLNSRTSAGYGASGRPNAVQSWAYWYTSAEHADGVSVRQIASEFHATHDHWYGHEGYGCQIGMACFRAWNDNQRGENRQGDVEGDVKLLFGGAVVKSAAGAQFVPYASMSVIVAGAVLTSAQGVNPPTYNLRDPKGNRVCPPYQGAAGGLATCGPLITIQGLPYDLFVTPTGTRPGQVLEPGDSFVFAGEAWPTLDVFYVVTLTSPSGKEQKLTGRASSIGHIDGSGKHVTVTEPGVWTVHVSATQDRPVPSTGAVPSPVIVADGKTKLPGYGAPLSAILGSKDSTYRFVVASPRADIPVATELTMGRQPNGPARIPKTITVTVNVPQGATDLRAIVAKPGLLVSDAPVGGGGPVRIELNADKLYADGFTNVVLGASALDVTVVGKVGNDWFARTVNLRGMTPLGGAKATIR